MHVFIDESGSFSGFTEGSIGAVGALSIPTGALHELTAAYNLIREGLPKEGGEVKGRLLDEIQVASVVSLLSKPSVLAVFELAAMDIGAHNLTGVERFKRDLAKHMTDIVPRFAPTVQPQVQATADQIRNTSVPLFLQAMTAWDVLEHVIRHVPTFFAQRMPQELGSFTWVVDGKEPSKVTEWERWWPQHAAGALAMRSKKRPSPHLMEGDYSHYARFNGQTDDGQEATNLGLLLADLRLLSEVEPGLEWVDILTNAVRRAMLGNLGKSGWQNIRRLMIHRPHHYISLGLIAGASTEPKNPRYAEVVRHFSRDGHQMISPLLQWLDERS